MVRALASIGLLFLLIGAPQAEATGRKQASGWHGAIAYHADSGHYGYAVNRRNARDARREALVQCGQSACEVMLDMRNGCGALARGERRLAARTGTTGDEAQAKSLKHCGPQCEVLVWACTR